MRLTLILSLFFLCGWIGGTKPKITDKAFCKYLQKHIDSKRQGIFSGYIGSWLEPKRRTEVILNLIKIQYQICSPDNSRKFPRG